RKVQKRRQMVTGSAGCGKTLGKSYVRRYHMKRLFIALAAAMPVLFAAMVAAAWGGPEGATGSDASPAKITICHKTGSDTNPWRRITLSSPAISNPTSPAGEHLAAPSPRHRG